MGQVGSVLTGQDPFADDKRKVYEKSRHEYYKQCGYQLKDGVWKTATELAAGNGKGVMDNVKRTADVWNGPNCQPGPWKADSQLPNVPTPRPPAPSPIPEPNFKLTPPGDLKWPNK